MWGLLARTLESLSPARSLACWGLEGLAGHGVGQAVGGDRAAHELRGDRSARLRLPGLATRGSDLPGEEGVDIAGEKGDVLDLPPARGVEDVLLLSLVAIPLIRIDRISRRRVERHEPDLVADHLPGRRGVVEGTLSHRR